MKLSPLSLVISGALLLSGQALAQGIVPLHKEFTECSSCHTAGMQVRDNLAAENAACVDCHGSYPELATEDRHDIDPHDSHLDLGNLNCTTCHSGHQESSMVCNSCHEYDMAMPAGDNQWRPTKLETDADAVAKAIAAGPVEQIDVLVIGSGASGTTAAVSAAQAGIDKILILEKEPMPGGNSMLAAGGMASAESSTQKALKIGDTKKVWYQDIMKGGYQHNDPALARTLSQNGAEGIEWLKSLGADLNSVGRPGGHSFERVHRPTGGAKAGPHIMTTLMKAVKDHDIEVRVNAPAVKLVVDNHDRIQGVVVKGKHQGYYMVGAKSVVIASGGFAANNDMVASFRPELKGMNTTNNKGNQGDGIQMVEEIGGKVKDVKEIQLFPTAAKGKILITGTIRGAGAILLNDQGQRFVNELGTRDVVSGAIIDQSKHHAWMLYDQDVVNELSQVKGLETLGLVDVVLSYPELEAVTGMPAKAAQASLERYNEFQMKGEDLDFGKRFMKTDVRFPIYVVDVSPAIHHTMGGIAINENTEVFLRNGTKIQGLYASGEVTGGVHGKNRLGGNAIADTVVFGRIAGAQAAKQVK
ncbi:flavocytochrome c [Ferrimonas sp. YFM]|uniref:flavocytochrome c n=1 Tax=Ferrimonas sp. YFM TaxID=3028878 RepID=UPI00257259F7|nr:flavocytochrome c [Ferrimonas sp. YFM]BDY06776.1 flavocytochrome c [Ferrimonas sp. YFM]